MPIIIIMIILTVWITIINVQKLKFWLTNSNMTTSIGELGLSCIA